MTERSFWKGSIFLNSGFWIVFVLLIISGLFLSTELPRWDDPIAISAFVIFYLLLAIIIFWLRWFFFTRHKK